MWMSSTKSVLQSTLNVTNMIKEELAGLDYRVYGVLGNHDVFPVNVEDFSLPNLNKAVLGIAPAWSTWLDADAIT